MAKTTLQKTSTEALVAELNSRTDCLVVGNIWSVNFLMEEYNISEKTAKLFIAEQQKAVLGLVSATDDLHEAMTDFVSIYNDCKQQILDLLPTYNKAVIEICSQHNVNHNANIIIRWLDFNLERLQKQDGVITSSEILRGYLKAMNEVISEAN